MFENLIFLGRSFSKSLKQSIRLSLIEEDFASIVSVLTSEIDKSPGKNKYKIALAYFYYFVLESRDEALKLVDLVLVSDSKNVDALYLKSIEYYKTSLSLSKKYALKALAANPLDRKVISHLLSISMSLEQVSDSIKWLSLMISTSSENWERAFYLSERAREFLKSSRFELSLSDCVLARRLDKRYICPDLIEHSLWMKWDNSSQLKQVRKRISIKYEKYGNLDINLVFQADVRRLLD